MANQRAVINLATGLEDAERVTVAFLVANAALEQGRQVAMFLTKEAVRLGMPGYAEGVACDGCPPLPRLQLLSCAGAWRRTSCTLVAMPSWRDAASAR